VKQEPLSPRVQAIFDRLDAHCEDTEEEVMRFDGLDEAVVGFGSQFTKQTLLVYSAKGIIEALMKQGMTHEEAEEWFGYNINCLWIGPGTPLILCDDTLEE
jgi:hypothetical protein